VSLHTRTTTSPYTSTLKSSEFSVFFFNATSTTDIYTLSLHDALPICAGSRSRGPREDPRHAADPETGRRRRRRGLGRPKGPRGSHRVLRAARPASAPEGSEASAAAVRGGGVRLLHGVPSRRGQRPDQGDPRD